MKCKKKACGGFISLEWNPAIIKDGLFVIEGECELCHTMYAVAMQLFEKSKLKSGTRLFADLFVLKKCEECMVCLRSSEDPHYFFCDENQKRIKDPSKFPKWCPLPRLVR